MRFPTFVCCWVFVGVIACQSHGNTNDNDAGVPSCVDEDGDGYGVGCDAGADCDDQRGDRWDECPPFRINPDHPRLYVDAQRVEEIRQAATAGVPLNAEHFPNDRGRIRFDLYPLQQAAPNWDGIFDRYGADRNHLFIRHSADNTTATELGVQVALQPVDESYIASLSFTLPYDTWHSLELAWNTSAHTAAITVNGVETPLNWRLDPNGLPLEWAPSDQRFEMRGPHGIDNVQLFDSDVPGGGSTLVSYEMDTLAGYHVVDSSGNDHHALVNQGASIAARSGSDPDLALWLTEDDSLRILATSPLTEAWLDTYAAAQSNATKLLDGTHTVDPAVDHPGGLISLARSIGLAYLVTGETQFVEAAQVYADLLLATAATEGNDYTTAGRAEAMGLLYDWFFGDLPSRAAPLRDAILAIVLEYERYICGSDNPLTADWRCTEAPHPDFVSGHSHQNDTEMMAALMAIADESPEAESLLHDMLDIFENGFNPARAWISVDGGHHMGWSYGATYTFLDSILLWEVTANVPMRAPWQGARIHPYIYGLRSDHRFPASGDGTFSRPDSQQLAAFALWGARHWDDPYARTYYEHWIRPTAGGVRDRELFHIADSVAGAPFSDLPLSRHFQNAGQVVMRESWDFDHASVVELKSTSFATNNHHHRDQNAFTVFYRAPLLVDSGYYDSYGTTHWHNYYTRTIAHNTVTVWDPNEEFRSGGDVVSNDGGQLIPPNGQLDALQEGGAWHLDGVTRFEDGGDYSYVVGNASKAYSSDKLDPDRGFLRSLVLLRAPSFWSRPVVVVFDEVNATPAQAGLTKRFLLHTATEPEPPDGTLLGPGQHPMPAGPVRIRNGGGMLLVQTLLPQNPEVSKIGGLDTTEDYRFMVPDAATGALVNFPPDSEPGPAHPDMGAWRLEVSSATPTERELFLHVLSIADDNPALLPPTALLLTTSGGEACFLGDSLAVVFRDDRAGAPDLSFQVPSAAFRVLVFGLAPSSHYAMTAVPVGAGGPVDVSLVAQTNGAVVTSAAGVADFVVP